jgi:hypothetical protein
MVGWQRLSTGQAMVFFNCATAILAVLFPALIFQT